MEVFSKVTIGVEVMQNAPANHFKGVVEEKLLQGMIPMLLEKMETSEELHEETNSIEYTGEIVALTKEEYRELKWVESEFYKMLSNNIKGGK